MDVKLNTFIQHNDSGKVPGGVMLHTGIAATEAEMLTLYAQACLLFIGPDYKVRSFTPHAQTCIRKVLKRELYPGMAIEEIMLPGFEALCREGLSEAFAGVEKEITIKHAGSGNSLSFVQIFLRPAKNSSNDIIGVVATCTDITGTMLLAEARRRSRHAMHLFGSIPLPAFIYDPETFKLLKVNSKAANHYGYKEAEMLSLKVLDLHPEEERKAVMQQVAQSIQADDVSIKQWHHHKKGGELLQVEVWGSTIRLNGRKLRLVIVHDVTEKIKVETELRESNERFGYVANATSDIVWDWHLGSETVLWSEHYQHIMGWQLPPSRKLPIGYSLDCLHPEDRERVSNHLTTLIRNKKDVIWENAFRYRRSDGSFAYVLNKGYIIRNEAGKALRLIGVLHDISEQQYRQELQELELRVFALSSKPGVAINSVLQVLAEGLSTLHEGTKSCIAFCSEKGAPVIVGARMEKRAASWLKSFLKDFCSHNHAGTSSVQTHQLSCEEGLILSDGPEQLQQLWIVPVQQADEELLAVLVLMVRWQREPSNMELNALLRVQNLLRVLLVHHASVEQIRLANERFDNVMKATHDLIWDWDLVTGSFYRSPDAAQKIYDGMKGHRDLGKPQEWMDRIHQEDQPKVLAIIEEIIRNPKLENFEVEYRVLERSGVCTHLYDRGIIIRNEKGRPVRMIGAAQDISERKRLEQELLQKELDRQKVISQATIDTQEQERAEIGKELHDNVNQILTTTKLYLDLAQSSPEMRDELLIKASKNINNVINEIRQLSRSLMDPSLGDLGLVDSVKDLIENINLTRKISVTLKVSESIETELDESRKLMVFRIIQEALSNIIRHAHATEAQIMIKRMSGMLQLQVKDNGIGFNPEQVVSGIGLKNIRNRVYLTNGQLKIKSAVGKGTTLSIKFPIIKVQNKNG